MTWVKSKLLESENDRLEDYQEVEGIDSKPDAVRSLMLKGLEQWEREQERQEHSGIEVPDEP